MKVTEHYMRRRYIVFRVALHNFHQSSAIDKLMEAPPPAALVSCSYRTLVLRPERAEAAGGAGDDPSVLHRAARRAVPPDQAQHAGDANGGGSATATGIDCCRPAPGLGPAQ